MKVVLSEFISAALVYFLLVRFDIIRRNDGDLVMHRCSSSIIICCVYSNDFYFIDTSGV